MIAVRAYMVGIAGKASPAWDTCISFGCYVHIGPFKAEACTFCMGLLIHLDIHGNLSIELGISRRPASMCCHWRLSCRLCQARCQMIRMQAV